MPKEWVRRHRRDYYYRKAKEEAYRSRAAYKLLQVVEKYDFVKLGDVVVDLGAAPGGWLQVAEEIVGEKGFTLGVDTKEIEPLDLPNICTIVGDIRESDLAKRIKGILPRLPDVVISDVSPQVSGIWELDHVRQIELAEQSLQIATSILKIGGHFFVKVFQGDMSDYFLRRMRTFFSLVEIVKPKASRAESAEIYVLGLGYKGQK